MDVILNPHSLICFMSQWQTLVGAAMGLFGAALIPIIGFILKTIHSHQVERKEMLRRIEIGSTLSFNETYYVYTQMQRAVTAIRALANRVHSAGSEEFSLEMINFPVTGQIYSDPDAKMFKTSSFYLHNKILMAGSLIDDLNRIIKNFKEDFSNLLRLNELMTTKTTPQRQKEAYAGNLIQFANELERYSKKQFEVVLLILTQISIYNAKMRKQRKKTLKEYEGSGLFRKNLQISSGVKDLSSVEAIDEIIREEVMDHLEKARARAEQENE